MSWIDAYRTNGRLDGACLCGAVTITVDGDHVAAVGVCHCGMCQRWSGLLYGTFDAAEDAVTVSGPARSYQSTTFSSRAFCAECGSHLWMRAEDGTYELHPGLFPQAAAFPLVSEIYVDRAPAYCALAGDHRTATRAAYEAKNPHVAGDAP